MEMTAYSIPGTPCSSRIGTYRTLSVWGTTRRAVKQSSSQAYDTTIFPSATAAS